jgi:uncharacterized protein YecE (DUF72 family)
MTLFTGTSGYSHAEWKGSFYPAKFSQKKMLEFYSQHFSAVEVNYTFRTLPSAEVVENWAEQVPASFRFVLKCSQSITHFKRLQNAEKETNAFLELAARLGKQQGPILVQLPPNFKKNIERLDAFLEDIDGRAKVAFEFRNATWLDDEVYDCLREHAAALCVTDRSELPETGLVHTANWGYLRLWDDNYTDARLRKWIAGIKAQKWREAYVFFMHEDEGISPKLAARFMKLSGP